ncbi:hypothetical protein CEK25_012340 [Fusarium fujikuroi]|nr:hypothetical protein CEK25_012340 [Fusarium fujikuroi]
MKLLLPYAEGLGVTIFLNFLLPLAFNPGSDFAYPHRPRARVAWPLVGTWIRRIRHRPLGIKDIGLSFQASQARRLASMHQRDSNGSKPFTSAEKSIPIDDMFTNQINFPIDARAGLQVLSASAIDDLFTHEIPEFYPVPGARLQGWRSYLLDEINGGATGPDQPRQVTGQDYRMYGGGATGRSTKTGHWALLPQILPFGDPKVLVWGTVARQIVTAAD